MTATAASTLLGARRDGGRARGGAGVAGPGESGWRGWGQRPPGRASKQRRAGGAGEEQRDGLLFAFPVIPARTWGHGTAPSSHCGPHEDNARGTAPRESTGASGGGAGRPAPTGRRGPRGTSGTRSTLARRRRPSCDLRPRVPPPAAARHPQRGSQDGGRPRAPGPRGAAFPLSGPERPTPVRVGPSQFRARETGRGG